MEVTTGCLHSSVEYWERMSSQERETARKRKCRDRHVEHETLDLHKGTYKHLHARKGKKNDGGDIIY